MIKKKGTFHAAKDSPFPEELLNAVESLKDGDYNFYILDDNTNRALPQLKYLNGVVLKFLSDKLPLNPPIGALYRYFEQRYAPIHYCNINGERFSYRDLKAEPSTEMSDVIDAIIHHAHDIWHIDIPTMEEMKQVGAKELYVGAYAEAWKDYFSINNSQQDS